ncbi:hypothetical protein B0T22DRAFT_500226 [Podospora appendiculata]|uniref:Rhodopsin domain-containing protein n=1 Tax=Podospora appendiculata TaxID=314037 RepID=A0AAE0X550_9PEZI|nr:hypothetical protein B0T22DRAFT_500226 [Podospora appendiculata]
MSDAHNNTDSTGAPMIEITAQAAYLARVHVGVTVVLLAVCLVPFVARVHVRISPVWRVGLDDWLILAGLLCVIADWGLLQKELVFSPGFIDWAQAMVAVRQAYLAIPVWLLSMSLIKWSVALTLLRIPLGRLWRAFLYCIMAIQAVFFVCDFVYIFAKCHPVRAAWDFSIRERRCPDTDTDVLVSNIGSGLNIAMDVLLSLAPMAVLWNLRRPARERVLVCFLTGIGLLASVSSVMKMVTMLSWAPTRDPWAASMVIGTWTILEQLLAVTAACSPSLKGPIQRMLSRCGVPITNYDSRISFINMSSRDGNAHGKVCGTGRRGAGPAHEVEVEVAAAADVAPARGAREAYDDALRKMKMEATSSASRELKKEI